MHYLVTIFFTIILYQNYSELDVRMAQTTLEMIYIRSLSNTFSKMIFHCTHTIYYMKMDVRN